MPKSGAKKRRAGLQKAKKEKKNKDISLGGEPSPLWPIVVSKRNDLGSNVFLNIILRFGRNDVKFLCDVNTETFEAVSVFKGRTLRFPFGVFSLSSISTLEFALKLWDSDKNKYFSKLEHRAKINRAYENYV